MDDDDDLGEDIWNAFSWRSHISTKIKLMQKYFEELSFPESHRKIIDFFDTYYDAYLKEDNQNNEEGLPPAKMKNSNVPRVISEECFFTFLDESDFTSIQELKLLELICSYFDGRELDIVRYFVFDCLFGNINEDGIQFRDAKLKFLGKLISMAVGVQCALVLECCAIFLQRFGRKNAMVSVITNVVNDYCYLIPSAYQILESVVQVSPMFCCQFVEALPMIYSFHQKAKSDGEDNKDEFEHNQQEIPPMPLMKIVGSWLSSSPKDFTSRKPHEFLLLPSIYNFQEDPKLQKKTLCSISGLLSWSVLSPLFAGIKINNKVIGSEEIKRVSSLLHYGILNYFSMHRKSDTSASGDEDDLEPGEVSEEPKPMELIFESNIKDVITHLDDTVERLTDEITKEKLGESIDRLAQIIQISKWSGCFLPTSKKFKHALKKVPKTKLFSKVLKTL